MKKSTCAICGAFALIALFIAGLSVYQSAAVRNTLATETRVLPVNAAAEENALEETPAAVRGKLNITMADGAFALADDAVFVLAGPDGGVAVPVTGARNVNYDEVKGVVLFETDSANYRVAAVGAADISTDNATVLTDGNGNAVIAGQRRIGDNLGVVVLATGFAAENEENAKMETVGILENAAPADGTMELLIDGNAVNDGCATDVLLVSDALAFGNAEARVYMAPYEGAIEGAGFDGTLALTDEMELMTGKYVDAESGLVPYLYSSENDFTMKVVAAGESGLRTAFAAAEFVESVEEPIEEAAEEAAETSEVTEE